jgi:abequosyltransferase
MRNPKLSICMPAYNYGRYIRTAIESVRGQSSADVELIVLDGGSTDDTREVVQRIAGTWPALRYVRQETRGGIDADLARSVELATGEYCWLLSADDALQEGALSRILAEFERGNDILLCNRIWCDAQLGPLHRQSWLENGDRDRTVDLSSDADLLAYLEAARSLGALFSFMSCIGFHRETWTRSQGPAVPFYTHVGRLLGMGRSGARYKYLAEPLVLCRGGTDSFRVGGLARRLLADLHAYRELAAAMIPADRILREAFLAVMRREHPLRRWIGARLQTSDLELWREVERELSEYGFSGLELSLINAVGAALRRLGAFVPGR